MHNKEDVVERTNMERQVKSIDECYFRGVQCQGIHRAGRWVNSEDFISYTPLHRKPWAEKNDRGEHEFQPLPPFWAVMLADRDGVGQANMRASIEEFTMPTGSVSMPFLVNTCWLNPGDLLLLPYDGCIRQICCATFPPI